MLRSLRMLLMAAALIGLMRPDWARGQSAPADETIPTPPRLLELPPSVSPPPIANPSVALPPPEPPPTTGWPPRETGVFGAPGQWDGWFVNVDGALIVPHIDSHLNSGTNIKAPFLTPSTPTGSVSTTAPPGSDATIISIFGRTITLPIAPLNWVGSPFVRVGYRFANGAGDVRFDWRMVASQGTDTVPNFDAGGNGLLTSRVNVQYARLTYGTGEYLTNDPTLNRNWSARFGAAAADVFFDSQARGQQILQQRASSDFAGVGLTVGFQFHKPIEQTRFQLYGELDATGLIGDTRQHFSETVAGTGGPFSASASLPLESNGIGIFGVEGGVSYVPWDDRTWRFTFGYQWQRWWWVGASSDANAALTLQGFFFRGEWRY